MNSLRKHPITLSLILWAVCLITIVVLRVIWSPDILTNMTMATATFLGSVIGILNWLLIFAAKKMGAE